MAFVTSADVKVKYDRVGREWAAIAAAASAASGQLSQSQMTTMGLLASRWQTMQADTPSFFRAAAQADTADALEKDMWAFASDLRGSGVPGLPAQPSAPAETTIDRLLNFAPLLLLGLVLLEIAPKGGRR